MTERNWIACALLALAPLRGDGAVHAQAHVHPAQDTSAVPLMTDMAQTDAPRMWMRQLGGGWTAMAMAQAYPIVTINAPDGRDSPLHATEFYLTQPALMANLQSTGARFVLRTTLNFEGLTLPDGELTSGAWGEGFIDRRHPHTLLHELMLSVNLWDVAGGAASFSAGKGFAPFGTDDPMARPGLKYPTNHHLSQVLERWTINAVYLHRRGTSLELGWFGGGEPTGPYDLSNIESFGNSGSVRIAQRFGGTGPAAAWELSGSAARVTEEHHGAEETTALWNAAIRHERQYPWGTGYALAEYSWNEPEHSEGFRSALVEGMVRKGRHAPYARLEMSTRPEYARKRENGDGFFRYDHDASPVAATRWVIANAGYGFSMNAGALSIRPFADVQWNHIGQERLPDVPGPGPICGCSATGSERRANEGIALASRCMCLLSEDPRFYAGSISFPGLDSFWTLSLGARIFFGGDPMRMGSYGVLDDMTGRMRSPGGHAH